MSNLYVVLLCAAACLACDEDLHYRISMGNYVIVNPDPDAYNGIQAYDTNGDACTTTVIPMYAFTVTGCGLVDVQVDLLIDDAVATSCTISSDGAEITHNGISVPIDFVLKSNSLLQSGSAHYHCKMQPVGSMVLVKNPRNELYKHSRAQDADGTECTTSHILENQVIEISDCNLDKLVILVVGKKPINIAIISRRTALFPIDCSGIEPAEITSTGDDDFTYNCYDDGSIVVSNPRTELFCFGYAEQNRQACDTTYVKELNEVIISGCSHEQPIVLVLSKTAITDHALVIRPNNVFMIDCSV